MSDTLKKVELVINDKSYTINGEEKTSDVSPVVVNNRTMVPLRFISEALGADVDWNKSTKTVTIEQNGKKTNLVIGKLSDGMDVAPFLLKGRTMVPLRYVSEALDCNVEWYDDSKTITIYK